MYGTAAIRQLVELLRVSQPSANIEPQCSVLAAAALVRCGLGRCVLFLQRRSPVFDKRNRRWTLWIDCSNGCQYPLAVRGDVIKIART